jgi:hypothetical protein
VQGGAYGEHALLGVAADGGADRARLHCRFVPPLVHFIPDSQTESVCIPDSQTELVFIPDLQTESVFIPDLQTASVFIPDLQTESVALFLRRQCDRPPGAERPLSGADGLGAAACAVTLGGLRRPGGGQGCSFVTPLSMLFFGPP